MSSQSIIAPLPRVCSLLGGPRSATPVAKPAMPALLQARPTVNPLKGRLP